LENILKIERDERKELIALNAELREEIGSLKARLFAESGGDSTTEVDPSECTRTA